MLAIDGQIVGRGRNQRLQRGSPILHAEMDCLENAGRLSPSEYRRSTLVSTLSPCAMCSGAIALYGIPLVIVGESRTFRGPEECLRSLDVRIEVLDDEDCRAILGEFIDAHPDVWHEDIGQP